MGEGHRGDARALMGSGDAMKQSQKVILAIMVCASWFATDGASADVDLVLRSKPQSNVGTLIEVGLYAVSAEETDFVALDAILSWDPTVLRLLSVDVSVHNWFLFGFLNDSGLDGLNADCGTETFCKTFTGLPWNDGDALLQALLLGSGIVATKDGVLITTFTFSADSPAVASEISFLPSAGDNSLSRVLQSGAVDVTGSLISAFVDVGPDLSAVDVHMPAGGMAEVWIIGKIAQQESIGVTILARIEEQQESIGSVTYTLAPPVDIAQRGDPWPGTGTFSALDTNALGLSPTLNGSVDDNGTFQPAVTDYSGPLVSFPITASSDAAGVWDIRLCEEPCGIEDGSFWNSTLGIPTARRHGIVRIVELGDGDDNQTIDLRDRSEFLACFTGGEAADPPAYSLAPELRCSVYDLDGNGAINLVDHELMVQVHLGP